MNSITWWWVALVLVALYAAYVSAVMVWWRALCRRNRKFNRARGHALAKWLAINGGVR